MAFFIADTLRCKNHISNNFKHSVITTLYFSYLFTAGFNEGKDLLDSNCDCNCMLILIEVKQFSSVGSLPSQAGADLHRKRRRSS